MLRVLRSTVPLVFIVPWLALAQAPARASRAQSDAPRIELHVGQTVRVTTDEGVQTGRVTGLGEGLLRFTRPDGRPAGVPLEALRQVEVRGSHVYRGLAAGAVGGGLLLGLVGYVYGDLSHALNDSGSEAVSVPAITGLAMLVGAGFGGALGAAIGARSTTWDQVYRDRSSSPSTRGRAMPLTPSLSRGEREM